MPSIERPLSGDVLVFALDTERQQAADEAILGRSGRNARTLLKDGPLRVTLVVLGRGGEIQEHQADGPITVQPLDGEVRFTVGDRFFDIGPGELLSAGAGVRHAVASKEGAAFLLTVAKPAETAPTEAAA